MAYEVDLEFNVWRECVGGGVGSSGWDMQAGDRTRPLRGSMGREGFAPPPPGSSSSASYCDVGREHADL